MNDFDQYKSSIAGKLKKLRRERKLTQQEVAESLGLSQAQFSKIENGKGSLTAEQFLYLLQRFNLGPQEFIIKKKVPDDESVWQNALNQLGASHLRHVPNTLVPPKLTDPTEAIIEILLTAPSSRLICGLVPVIVKNYAEISYNLIADRLNVQNLANRFGWILEGTCRTLEKRISKSYLSRTLSTHYQKAFLLIERKLQALESFKSKITKEDELDRDLLTQRTIDIVKKSRDKCARHWHIVTRIKKEDFEKALLDAEENV